MTPTTYVVTGINASGATFTRTLTGTASGTTDSLATGDWTVTAEAKNADGTLIGVGTGSATVTAGATATVAITVVPYSGTGTLTLALSWTPADIPNPVVEASLLPATGTARTLTFIVNSGAGTASFSATDIPTGYHTLTLKLKDGSNLASGTVEVVRIVKGQSTSGTFLFDKVNKSPGTITTNITPSMADPLVVIISGGTAIKEQNQTQTLTASVSNYSDNVSYVWYANGSSVGTGANFSFGTSYAVGNYNISVTAFSSDGKQAGNVAISIQIPQPTSDTTAPGEVTGLSATAGERQVTLNWIVPADNDYAGVQISGSGFTTFTVNKGTTSTQVTGLTNDTSYSFLVKTMDNSRNLSTGTTISATPVHIYIVGETGPAGGLVFYDKGSFSSGWRYLEASPVDLGNNARTSWDKGTHIQMYTSASIGSGKANTQSIIAKFGTGTYAGALCDDYSVNGFSDWYLPSSGELSLMYNNLCVSGKGGFNTSTGYGTSGLYWSSTQDASNPQGATDVNFYNGAVQLGSLVSNNFLVRAVRYF